MSIEQIKQDCDARFLNEEFSINLAPNHSKVDNANDVLYQAVYLNLLDLHKELKESDINNAEIACSILRKEPGHFYRWTHNKETPNSHDNYEGLASMQVYGVNNTANEICEFGSDTGFDYELVDDGDNFFRSIWQPGTIALFRIYNDQRPYFLDLCFLVVAILIGSFQWKKHTHHKLWHNVWTIRRKIGKYGNMKEWRYAVLPLAAACLVFDIVSIIVFGNRHQAVVNYYAEEDHPNRRLALELIRKESNK
jgi:hypothetical protein